ncbi:branched-chain amino acid ABC transporter permease [Nakamurella sp. PAMC28650]|jgi:branched-chain amino acid transport system permease protein|uniref:branched-chain amino acid ABC transporter permease n=1 Tax=Nakamurella sp. PAMC28650 TaxID=2762325 RepID=UPI00164ED2E8|nr:branched-chain amino acid ABC transporter permease [Nakamurella sp. PAMC28650]QNK79760.1 branched-chain amino acid ABC transporter permease [Nakamurella sp. PAMC28650]
MATLVIGGTRRKAKVRLGPILERYIGLAVLALGIVWVIWNLIGDPSRFLGSILVGAQNGMLYALIALGYTMVYGIIELINFAHGDLFMLATIVAANVMVHIFGVSNLTLATLLPLIITLAVAMAFGAFINVSAEFLAYRKLRNAPKLAPLMTAVGLSFIFRGIAQQDWINGSAQKNWDINWGGPIIQGVYLYKLLLVLVVTVPLLLAMTYIVGRTKRGKAMRAVAQDQDGARLMGINVNGTISFTFALGGALAGAAGVLYFLAQTQTYYDTGTQLGLIAFTAAVLGGIGNLLGAVVGGLLIGLIQGINEGGAHGLGQAWSQSVVFLILIVFMVFKPEGIFGRRTTEKV